MRESTRALAPLLMAFLLALAACNGGGEPEPSPTPSPSAAATSVAPTPSPLQAARIVDLATDTPAGLITGADSGDLRSDLPTLVTGDFNDDGADDVLLGARFGDGPANDREDAGEAYIIFGDRSGLPEVDIAAGEQDVTVWGAAPGDSLGFSAATADVNDDGVTDIVLGALLASPDTTAQFGAVYVYFGRADWPAEIDVAATAADVTLIGPAGTSFFGDSLATGDINDDGLDDVIVGATFAPQPDGASGRPGATYVVFGREDWPSTLSMADGDYDVAVYGEEDLDEIGDTVASGDINDDGIDDILITGEAADGPDDRRPLAAEVRIVLGSPGLAGDLFLTEGAAAISVYGAYQNHTLGFSLAAGDVTGDGVDDAIMGARGETAASDPSAPNVGAVYVLPGASGLEGSFDLAERPPGIIGLYGAEIADAANHGFAADIDGDGAPELIVGASTGDGPANDRSDAGEIYVLGNEAVAAREGFQPVTASPLALAVFGALPGDHLGAAVATGDLDGDGSLELLVLAADADHPGGEPPDAGRLYILSLSGG